jgi:hypothetical protein
MGVCGWVGGGVAKHSLFCCMIARMMPLGGAISPKRATHAHTPPVGLSQSVPQYNNILSLLQN